ncbi:N-formylglutamate amidohydrolase [[Pseudomonas] carboxydohydrogena]|uniref:N-formylglutamate amidohydrolase n=1 Tax=Afipia carboxydohydrogena TaxID=290 RepID=A0ABY8BRS6_AFICR|nr:N-formylglutamate amidohydrolase [[Pseudomonas] carboxydohydrogena]WEF52399.1 N-formylglutamate amidohydrolase [[Pseudomonas] carboxydohydrogena]
MHSPVSHPLLDADEIPPVREDNPESSSPFLLTCDHYGKRIPERLRQLGLNASDLERHIACDIGIAGVATRLAQAIGAHLIAQRYSRLVIDCNRPFESPGSIPLISEATHIPGNDGLDFDDVAARRREIFTPYHARIAQVLDQRAEKKQPTILLSLHSFTPVYAGVARPWHVGTLYQNGHGLPPLLLKLLRAEGHFIVGDNEPYAVSDATDYTIPVHGERRKLINSGLEIRQDLIAEEAGQIEWAERLTRIVHEIEGRLLAQGLVKR